MPLFFIVPSIIILIVFVTIITVIIRVIRFGFKVGKNVSQTILDKTDPNKNKKDQTSYSDDEMSLRLQQDYYAKEMKNYVVCKYCGSKNKRSTFRCSSCNAPLDE